MKSIFLFLFGFILITQSCSVAKFSSMPKTATDINFAKYESELRNTKEPFWTSKTSNEYFIEINKICKEQDILQSIGNAYSANNYGFSKFNKQDKAVFAERGMRMNEWKSIAGIYYQIDELAKKTRIYILVKITQDVTGGWKENRAKKLGLIIEKELFTH
jgi:hypothetical protein